jgi:hypothetical protein
VGVKTTTDAPAAMSVALPSTTPAQPAVVVDEDQRASTGDGDHDRFTHYVSRRDLERFRATGRPVTALCGKRWKPDADPTRYPMCATCAEIAAERLMGQLG